MKKLILAIALIAVSTGCAHNMEQDDSSKQYEPLTADESGRVDPYYTQVDTIQEANARYDQINGIS